MTFSLKSAALSAAVVTSLFAAPLAHAGSDPVDTVPPPPVVVPPPTLVVTPQVVAVLTQIASAAGLGNLATALSTAKPGSPEAKAAVVSIVAVLSQQARIPSLNTRQAARARSAIRAIIARNGGSAALTALLGRL